MQGPRLPPHLALSPPRMFFSLSPASCHPHSEVSLAALEVRAPSPPWGSESWTKPHFLCLPGTMRKTQPPTPSATCVPIQWLPLLLMLHPLNGPTAVCQQLCWASWKLLTHGCPGAKCVLRVARFRGSELGQKGEKEWAAARPLLAGFLFTVSSCPSHPEHKCPGETWYVFRLAVQTQM